MLLVSFQQKQYFFSGQNIQAFEAAKNLYNLLGHISGHKNLDQDEISVTITQHTLGSLLKCFKVEMEKADYTALTNIIRLLVEFSRGFKSTVQSRQIIDTFSGVLSEICQLMKIPGVANIAKLQEQIIKLIETNVTILGAVLKPLIIEAALMQIQQIHLENDTTGEQISKLEPALQMLDSFIGKIREDIISVIEVMDGMFGHIF